MTPEQFAQWRALGIRAGVAVYRGELRGWFLVCADCEVERESLGAQFAGWDADSHNRTPAHALAMTL